MSKIKVAAYRIERQFVAGASPGLRSSARQRKIHYSYYCHSLSGASPRPRSSAPQRCPSFHYNTLDQQRTECIPTLHPHRTAMNSTFRATHRTTCVTTVYKYIVCLFVRGAELPGLGEPQRRVFSRVVHSGGN
jgi:hypothetical protein